MQRKKARGAHLGESLSSLFEIPVGEFELLSQSGRFLFAELELQIDNLLLASEVSNDFSKLLRRFG